MADGKRGRPAGLNRKSIIMRSIEQLIVDGFFKTWRRSSEVAEQINNNIPNHWKQLSGKSCCWFLKRFGALKHEIIPNGRIKKWKQREENINDDNNGGKLGVS